MTYYIWGDLLRVRKAADTKNGASKNKFILACSKQIVFYKMAYGLYVQLLFIYYLKSVLLKKSVFG